jgi:hypothetical protein
MKTQTAVWWLEKEFIKLEATIGVYSKMYELVEQAKEMEKQQMIKFANDFLFHDDTDLTAEQYYNETFNK